MIKWLSIFLSLTTTASIFAKDACSRIAIINYREVPVDTGNNDKGEGLKFYLQKDPVSAELLDEYQDRNRPSKLTTVLNSTGSIMVLAGLLQTDETARGLANKNTLLYGGILISGITHMVIRTMQYNNEDLLHRAIEQYNKRNSPRIYFSPYKNDNGELGIGVNVGQEF